MYLNISTLKGENFVVSLMSFHLGNVVGFVHKDNPFSFVGARDDDGGSAFNFKRILRSLNVNTGEKILCGLNL